MQFQVRDGCETEKSRSMRKNYSESLAVIFVLVFFLAGCATGGTVEPSFETAGKKIVFVPFRERDLYCFESRLGMQVSALLATVVSKMSEELKVVDVAPAAALIEGKDPDKIDWQEVGRTTGADYVVLGFIKILRARDPLDVNCYKGVFEAEIAVIQTATGEEVMGEDISVTYPSGRFEQEFLSVLETTEDKVLEKVKEHGVKKMAEFFYPHPPPDE
jgi:TolB-like protein